MGLTDEHRVGSAQGTDLAQSSLGQAERAFKALPLVEQLTLSHQTSVRNRKLEALISDEDARWYAIQSLFSLTPQERERLGIRIYAVVFLDGENKIEIRHGEYESYDVIIAYPTSASITELSTTRIQIGRALAESDAAISRAIDVADQNVLANAELIDPSYLDIYGLLVRTVKKIDGAIGPLHRKKDAQRRLHQGFALETRQEDEDQLLKLNQAKHKALLEYLDIADKLEERYPHLGPLYRIIPDRAHEDYNHVTIEIVLPQLNYPLFAELLYSGEQLPDELELYSFESGEVQMPTTNFNFTVRSLARDRDYIELCDRLRARQIEQARREFGG